MKAFDRGERGVKINVYISTPVAVVSDLAMHCPALYRTQAMQGRRHY